MDKSNHPAGTTYDEVPYPSMSYAQTHPNRLASLATLLGMEPAPVERCRVLELGCAGGGNLIPMAYTLPEAEFIGVDSSSRQIEDGVEAINALGLSNIRLLPMDILGIRSEFGQFDYIIAHGVFSWVPRAVREKILQVCKQNLTPNGIAYVSYNVYPGWHMMAIIREAMLFHTRKETDPDVRASQARDLLDFLVDAVPDQSGGFGNFLQSYAQFLQGELKAESTKGNALLLHDELEPINEPMYFHEFIELAEKHGLQYLVEATLSDVMPDRFPPRVRGKLGEMADDLIEMEQYMDFLRNRTLRKTLLCHAEVELERALKPERVVNFHFTSRAKPLNDDPDVAGKSIEKFKSLDGATLAIDHPLSKAAMVVLGKTWPRLLAYEDLRGSAGALLHDLERSEPTEVDERILGANLLKAYGYSTQLVDFHLHVPPIAAKPGKNPIASQVARFLAASSDVVTNLRHERVNLDAFQRHLIGYLDGSRGRKALLHEIEELIRGGRLKFEKMDQRIEDEVEIKAILKRDLERHLEWFAEATLLVDEGRA